MRIRRVGKVDQVRTSRSCQTPTFGSSGVLGIRSQDPPDGDMPFWVGCDAVLEPVGHMRINQLRRREFVTAQQSRGRSRRARRAGDASGRCVRRYMEDEHKGWNNLVANAGLSK